MKILIASDTYIYQTSGAANVVIALADGLRKQGHDVRVLALSNSRTSFRDGDDFFIKSFPSFVYPDVRLSLVRHDPLLDELKQWKPDIIHLHTEAAIARMAFDIAEEAQAPIVTTTHTDYAQFAFGRFRNALPIRLIMKTGGKHFYRHAKAVVVPSEKACSFAQVQGAGERVTVIPNGIHLASFQKPVSPEERAALFSQYGLKDNGCTMVMVTRLSREKNIIEILRYLPALLKSMPQAQLIITGDGPDRKRLESYVIKHDLARNVRFTGRVDPDQVYRYYALGDLFVSASTFEVHSLSYLEAMACGLPLVCREDASLKNVLEDGENGIIYHTEDDFVSAVIRILGDSSLRESMHEKALEKVMEYDDEHFVNRTLGLYAKVLGI